MAAVRPHFFLPLFLLTLSFFSSSLSITEAEALLKLKKSFTNSDPSLASWLPNTSPCAARWKGVICFDNVISSLHLTDLGLSGMIDIDAINEIRGIRTLSFAKNNFSGPIPEFNRLGALKALYLSENKFSGSIPQDFFSHLDSLKKIWLDGNKFSGNIPESIVQPEFLKQVHLEDNEFSGPVPAFMQDLITLNVSYNKLEGRIPESVARYGPKAFEGNQGLCGKPLDKACEQHPPALEKKQENGSVFKIILIVAVVIIGVLLCCVVTRSSSKRRDDDFSVLSRESIDQVVQVHVASSIRSRSSESSRKGISFKRGSTKNGSGDLVVVNDEKGIFGLPDLMKAAAEVLGNGPLGSAYKAAMASGLSVVVKRMREINQISRDAFDAEMRRIGRIRHPNILTPLAYHFRKEEKLFVSEYIPKGSLLYLLHGDRGICHADLNWPTRLKIVQGIAGGLNFLHSEFSSYDLPHGNLKSSNVLLSDTYEPLLNDYAYHPLINPNSVVQSLFAYKSPDYVQYQKVSQKTDVYCLGIIILEIITGKFPSQYHSNGKGGTDVVQWVLTAISEGREAELIDPEIGSNTSSLDQMLQLVQIGAACSESNPDHRLDMGEAIRRIEEVHV